MIRSVNARQLPPPGGHYSHVNIFRDLAFISGQLPIGDTIGVVVGDSFKEQARQVLHNIDLCLQEIGVSRQHLVQLRVFVTDMTHWKDFDALYGEWIGEHRPSRAVVGVSDLHFGALIEVEAVAAIVRG
jgi:reactive intermediate/imine deaminase